MKEKTSVSSFRFLRSHIEFRFLHFEFYIFHFSKTSHFPFKIFRAAPCPNAHNRHPHVSAARWYDCFWGKVKTPPYWQFLP